MTDAENIIKAKAEAANAMATALNQAIDSGWVENLKQVQSFLSTWASAVNQMAPAEEAKDSDPSPEPAIGQAVLDKDHDMWTRADDGLWALVGGSLDKGDITWAQLQKRWGPLTPR